ncbi:MAG: hypothetical protein ACP5E4_03405 [Candidatus Aenigmatarchaeota archaeon]
MKGQYRIINELLIFGITAAVIFSVAGIISFTTGSMKSQTQKEQYILMGDILSMAITKNHLCSQFADCSLSVDLPERLSEDRYTIELEGNSIEIANFETGEYARMPVIFFNETMEGFVTSSGRYFTIYHRNNTAVLAR